MIKKLFSKLFKSKRDIYICAYCDTQMTNNSFCVPCNEYDGAMLKSEWEQFNLDNPRIKVGA